MDTMGVERLPLILLRSLGVLLLVVLLIRTFPHGGEIVGHFKIGEGGYSRRLPLVLLTAYEHSGSSVVGSVLGVDPRTMYFYEPVDALYMAVLDTPRWQSHLYTHFLQHGARRPLYPGEKAMLEYYLDKMAECDVQALPPEMCHSAGTLTGYRKHGCHHSCHGLHKQTPSPHLFKTISVSRIIKSNRYKDMLPCYTEVRGFMNDLYPVCRKSQFLTMKILRYDLEHILSFAAQRNIFVIHLLRDPRGIINSFIKKHEVKTDEDIKLASTKICGVMKHNIQVLQKVNTLMRSRVKVVRHEDFARRPREFTAGIFKGLGLGISAPVIKWLENVTGAKQNFGKFARMNSTRTAYQWVEELSHRDRRIIDGRCASLYQHFTNNPLLI